MRLPTLPSRASLGRRGRASGPLTLRPRGDRLVEDRAFVFTNDAVRLDEQASANPSPIRQGLAQAVGDGAVVCG